MTRIINAGTLPAAFTGADQSSTIFGDPHAHVGQPVWLGLPVLSLALRQPIRIRAASLVDHLPVSNVEFFDAPLYGVNEGRHITILTQDSFVRYQLHTDGPLVGQQFLPGTPTHYVLVRVIFTRPGHYEFSRFRVWYQDDSGAKGSQLILQTFQVGVEPATH